MHVGAAAAEVEVVVVGTTAAAVVEDMTGSESTGTQVKVVESQVRPELAQHPKSTVCCEQSAPDAMQVGAATAEVDVDVAIVAGVEEETTGSESTGTQVRVVESQVRPELAQQPKSTVCCEQSAPEAMQVGSAERDVVLLLETV